MTNDWLIEILSIKVSLRIREQHPNGKFLTNPQREGLKTTMVSVSPSTKHKLSNTLATLANFFIYASPIILLLPSRELTCPFPNHFWRWFSFSKGEIWYVICYFPAWLKSKRPSNNTPAPAWRRYRKEPPSFLLASQHLFLPICTRLCKYIFHVYNICFTSDLGTSRIC